MLQMVCHHVRVGLASAAGERIHRDIWQGGPTAQYLPDRGRPRGTCIRDMIDVVVTLLHMEIQWCYLM